MKNRRGIDLGSTITLTTNRVKPEGIRFDLPTMPPSRSYSSPRPVGPINLLHPKRGWLSGYRLIASVHFTFNRTREGGGFLSKA